MRHHEFNSDISESIIVRSAITKGEPNEAMDISNSLNNIFSEFIFTRFYQSIY